jgi:hypothetical protein
MKMVQNEDPSFGTPSTGMPKIKTTNNHPYPQFSTFPRNPGTPEPRNPRTPRTPRKKISTSTVTILNCISYPPQIKTNNHWMRYQTTKS